MGRDEEIEYARQHNIPIKQTSDKPYSYDDNMWGVTGEGGEIEKPGEIPKYQDILQVCAVPEQAHNEPEQIELEFEQGLPVSLNGYRMKLADLIIKLNQTGARHGIGIVTLIEDR
jgi:argininosuccinate synthase